METEIWKTVKKTTKNLYEVSNLGRTKINGIIKEHKSEGYPKFLGKRLHRWVAELFIPNPENLPIVDHIDTNVHNNREDNLHWVTAKGNANNPISKKKLSDKAKNRVMSEDVKKRISQKLKGRPSPMKGKHHTEETKQNLSEIHKNQWLNSEYRQKVIDGVKIALDKPESKQKRSEMSKKNWGNPEYKQKQIEASKKNWETPEYRQKQIEARKGEKNGFFGKHHTEETKQKMRKPKTKYLWLTENGEQVWMAPAHVAMHHKNWKLIQKINNT